MAKRFAAGRARAVGLATRGSTAPNRLRRVDRYLVGTQAVRLRAAAHPLVVDLGFGSHPVTTLELSRRLAAVRPDVEVLGLEIDPERVDAALPYADPPRLRFEKGGFELSGRRPVLVRAMNVLRQYDEAAAAQAWTTLQVHLAPGGLLVEGTTDELGRRGSWVCLDSNGPLTLTLAARCSDLPRPSALAQRLPKALTHHNMPGQPIHEFLRAFDAAWAGAAPYSAFGPRQRWVAAVEQLATAGWPVVGRRARWRLGEVTVRWSAVSS